MKWFAFAAVAAVVAGTSAPARADEHKVAVEKLTGPGAERIRDALVRVLAEQDGYQVVSDRKVAGTAKKLGLEMTSADDYVSVARELGLSAFVGGTVAGGKKFKTTIWVRNGLDGEVLTEGAFNAPGPKPDKMADVVSATFWKRMGSVIGDARPPAAGRGAKDEVAESAEPSEDRPAARPSRKKKAASESSDEAIAAEGESDSSGPAAPRPVALDVAVGSRVFRRELTYTDDIHGQLRPYKLDAAPAPGFSLDWYPAAHFTGGVAANIGISASAEYAVALASKAMSGAKYPTSAVGYSAGLRYRIPLGASEASATAAYGMHSFTIKDASATEPRPDIPNVAYKHARGGAALRVALPAGLALLVSGAYLHVLSSGEIEAAKYFPRSKVGGVEASLGFAYGLWDGLEARLGADLRRYFFTMNPEVNDPYIAGGALDQYISVSASIAYRLGEKSAAE